jgi:Domain of unknown function (DUF4397)
MKNRTTIKIFLSITFVALLTACGDSHNYYANVVPASGARVKFLHTAADAPAVNVYANDAKVNGAVPTAANLPVAISYLGLFPSVDYAVVPAGSPTFKVVAPAAGTTPETTVLTGALPVEDGKYYSVFAIGTAPNYSILALNDNLDVADPTKAYIRFVNLISNTPTTGMEVGITQIGAGEAIYTGVGYKGGKPEFLGITPVASGGTAYTFELRNSGSKTVVKTLSLSPAAGRVYTIYAMGIVGNAAKAPTLAFYTNK